MLMLIYYLPYISSDRNQLSGFESLSAWLFYVDYSRQEVDVEGDPLESLVDVLL